MTQNQNVKGLHIPISFSTNELNRSISQVRNSFNQANKSLRDVQKALKLDPKGLKGVINETGLLEKSLREAQVHYELLNRELAVAETAGIDKLGKEFSDIVLKIGHAKREIDKFQLALNMKQNLDKGIIGHLDNVRLGISEIAKEQIKWGNVATKSISVMDIALGNLIARGIAGTIRGLKNITKESLNLGIGFEEAIANLKALYGDEITKQQMQDIIDKAKQLGQTTVYSATEVAESMRSMALAGYDSVDTINAIEGALNLASASGENFETVSSIMVDGLKAFGYGTHEATKFADSLGLTAVITNADVKDLGEALSYVGAVAGTFKYDVNDVNVALGAMASTGIKGSMAGTALRQMILRLANNTSEALDTFKSLGGEFYTTEGKARPLIDVLNDLREGIAGLTDEQKANVLATIGGQRAITGLSAIVSMNAEDWEDISNQLHNSAGAVEAIAKQRLDNLAGDVKLLKNNLDDVKLDVFEEMKPSLRELTQEMTKFIKSGDMKNLSKGFADLGISISKNLIKSLEFTSKHFDTLTASVKVLIPTLITAKGAFSVSKNILAMANASKMTDVAIQSLGISLGKIGLTSVAVVGGIALLKAGFDKFNKNYQESVQYITDTTNAIESNRQAIIDNAQATKDSIDKIKASAVVDKSMLVELDRYVDKNGEIKQGYQERVDFILTELAGAYNIEYEILDGAIVKWDELKQSIKEASEARMIEAIATAYQEEIIAGIAEQGKAQENLNKAYDNELILIKQVRDDLESMQGGSYWTHRQDEYQQFLKMSYGEQLKYIKESEALLTVGGYEYIQINTEIENSHQALRESMEAVSKAQENLNIVLDDGFDGYEKINSVAITFREKTLEELELLAIDYQKRITEINNEISNNFGKDNAGLEEVKADYIRVLQDIDVEIASRKDSNLIISAELDTTNFYNTIDTLDSTIANKGMMVRRQIIESAEQGTRGASETIDRERPIIENKAQAMGGGYSLKLAEGINYNVLGVKSAVEIMSGNALSGNKLTEAEGIKGGIEYTRGITSGINSGAWSAIQSVVAMANAMNVAFRNTLDIQSPSKVGYESALWYPAGVVNAIRDSIPNVVNVTSQFANAIDETMFNARRASINAMQSVGKINYETDISNMFINALSNLQLIIEAYIDMDGRPIANHISRIQGMQIKRGVT